MEVPVVSITQLLRCGVRQNRAIRFLLCSLT